MVRFCLYLCIRIDSVAISVEVVGNVLKLVREGDGAGFEVVSEVAETRVHWIPHNVHHFCLSENATIKPMNDEPFVPKTWVVRYVNLRHTVGSIR